MTIRSRLRSGVPLVALCAALAASPAPAQVFAARINGVGITVEQIERSFDEYIRDKGMQLLQIRNPERMKQYKREVLDLLIEQELFAQEAARTGRQAQPAEVQAAYESMRAKFKSAERFELKVRQEGYTEQSYRAHLARIVSARKYADVIAAGAAPPTDDDVHRYFVENPQFFSRPEQVVVRQILVALPQGAGEDDKDRARRKLAGLREQARNGADFAELARQFSDDVTKPFGGEMDPFARGQQPQSFEEAAFALAPGGISDIVETARGLHLIKLEARHDAVTITEDRARERIRAYLTGVNGQAAVDRERERLRAAARVEMLLPY